MEEEEARNEEGGMAREESRNCFGSRTVRSAVTQLLPRSTDSSVFFCNSLYSAKLPEIFPNASRLQFHYLSRRKGAALSITTLLQRSSVSRDVVT